MWEVAVGLEDVYLHSSLIKKVTDRPPIQNNSNQNDKNSSQLIFSGICVLVLPFWTVLEGERLMSMGTRSTLTMSGTSSKWYIQRLYIEIGICAQAWRRDHCSEIRPARLCARHALACQGRHLRSTFYNQPINPHPVFWAAADAAAVWLIFSWSNNWWNTSWKMWIEIVENPDRSLGPGRRQEFGGEWEPGESWVRLCKVQHSCLALACSDNLLKIGRILGKQEFESKIL